LTEIKIEKLGKLPIKLMNIYTKKEVDWKWKLWNSP
jgi:hypothetical protein